jgi:hypothetical protein
MGSDRLNLIQPAAKEGWLTAAPNKHCSADAGFSDLICEANWLWERRSWTASWYLETCHIFKKASHYLQIPGFKVASPHVPSNISSSQKSFWPDSSRRRETWPAVRPVRLRIALGNRLSLYIDPGGRLGSHPLSANAVTSQGVGGEITQVSLDGGCMPHLFTPVCWKALHSLNHMPSTLNYIPSSCGIWEFCCIPPNHI